MKEQIKQLVAQLLIEQSQLKLLMRNLSLMDRLTDEMQNEILDEIESINETIEKLRKGL